MYRQFPPLGPELVKELQTIATKWNAIRKIRQFLDSRRRFLQRERGRGEKFLQVIGAPREEIADKYGLYLSSLANKAEVCGAFCSIDLPAYSSYFAELYEFIIYKPWNTKL